ncbi:penicillin-binding protein activator [Parahaliea maris]|nr:penicillin-binding protein activator [Parahaliea maris]
MTDYLTTPPARRALPTALLAGLLLLAGCAETPVQTTSVEPPPETIEPPTTTVPDLPTVDRELPGSIYAAEFSQAESLLANNDWLHAGDVLSTLPEELDLNDRAYLSYLQARIAWQHGQPQQAAAMLVELPAPGTALALQEKIINFQRYMGDLQGDYLASARQGSQLLSNDPMQPGAAALKRSIWRDLERVPAEQLAIAEGDTDNPDWNAWLTLARITAEAGTADELEQALVDWRADHPAHPAANPLPGGLDALLEQPLQFDTVALLLPLSGRLAPAAKAVRDGYLAAFYRASAGKRRQELLVLDTNAYPDAIAAYQDAVRQGASMVVGPLSKQAVAELGQLQERTVPVLALNRSDEPAPPGPTALVQLSLSPEDEVETLVEQAWGRGARRALIVRPGGEWGDKLDQILRQQWQALGGEIATTATYASAEAYSDTIKQAFQLDASEARAREIRSMLATNIEATARRRQDFDAIFLLSGRHGEARAIKPLLAFHYAGDVPVLAPSAVYSGLPGRGDSDLNGILLAELPWLLGADPGLRVAIAAGGTGSDSYTRLNALGADAYLLQRRFAQLQSGPEALFRGSTGLLHMDPYLRIIREPAPATFDGGRLKPL